MSQAREPFMTRGARYSAVFLFLLVVVLAGGNYLLSASAVHKTAANSASLRQLCETGNEARAEQVTLWTHLIAISAPPPHETPAQRAQRTREVQVFLAYVRSVFAPHDCQKGT